MYKLKGRRTTKQSSNGYLLPVVLILGLAISIVSATALQIVVSNSSTLNSQYYTELALNAAQAGAAAATECIDAGQTTWTTAKPLTPQTDCTGTVVASQPTTISNVDNVVSTYSVTVLENPYSNTTRIISSTGTVSVQTAAGVTVQTFTKNVRTFGNQNVTSSGGFTNISNSNTSNLNGCAISGGQAYCWGAGSGGRLGNNSVSNSLVPVPVYTGGVLSGKTVTAISTGYAHTCAIASGQAYCWGQGTSGQLGNNTTTQSNVPVAVYTGGVLSGKTVTAISTGDFHTCALVSTGQVYCWGEDNYGQLGDNNIFSSQSAVPVAVYASGVLSGKTVTAISGGLQQSCAIAGGLAYCWGQNTYGELGNNSTSTSYVPVAVTTTGVLSGKTVTAISVGGYYTCAVASGQAYCWGRGTNGVLGNNSGTNSSVPVAVTTTGVLSGKTVTAISSGISTPSTDTCAVASGQAYCWGNGYLGNGSLGTSYVPVAVSTSGVLSGQTVTAISAGDPICVIASGMTYCWGDGINGALGNNSTAASTVPVAIYTTAATAPTTTSTFDNPIAF